MTESSPRDETADDPPQFVMPDIQATIDWYHRPDVVLQDLIGVANIGYGVAITLYLPWGVVSGHVAAPHVFFEGAAAALREAAAANGDESQIGLTDVVANRSFDRWADREPEEDRFERQIQQGYDLTSHIHLVNVQAWPTGAVGLQRHEHLRVRLDAVTAWTYGAVRAAEED